MAARRSTLSRRIMITYAVWKSQTSDAFRPRSPELKIIDGLLQRLDACRAGAAAEGDRMKLVLELDEALGNWKRGKADWRRSIRNRHGAVGLLDAQLHAVVRVVAAPGSAALAAITAEREGALSMFSGKQLESSATRRQKLRASAMEVLKFDQAVGKVHKVRKEGFVAEKETKTGAEFAKTVAATRVDEVDLAAEPGPMLRALFGQAPGWMAQGAEISKELAATLGNTLFGRLGRYVPLLGAVLAGKAVVEEWAAIVQRRRERRRAELAESALLPGSAEAALRAIDRILQREIAQHSRQRLLSGAEFLGQVAIPAGATAIGGASGIGQFCETIYQVGRDYHEKRRANVCLKQGGIDRSIFGKAPILGAYFLACSTRSTILNFVVDGLGDRGWMDRVEALDRVVQPVIQTARRMISDSRFQLAGMPLMAIEPASNPTDAEKEAAKQFAKLRKYYSASRLRRFFMSAPAPLHDYGSAGSG